MRKVIVLALFLFPLFVLAHPSTTAKMAFFKGSLKKAQETAAYEGRLYFVEFSASWCQPCRWMDETTFTDPRLIEYVKGAYVPVKVDIDSFDGYGYKQQYNIKLLPTILVFNSKGELLGRYEESFAPSKLLKVLKSYDTANNRRKLRTSPPTGPKPKLTPAPSTPILTSTTSPSPSPKPRPEPKTKERDIVLTQATGPQVKPEDMKPGTTVAVGDGLYKFKVWKQESKGFSVQVGVFGKFENVLKEVESYQRRFSNQSIIVNAATMKSGRRVFKILIGEFDRREEASSYQQVMTRKGVPGMIKNLATMK